MPRRRTRWIDNLFNFTVSNGSETVQSLTAALTEQETQEMTVERMLMCYSMSTNSPGADNGTMLMDIGVGITSQEAFAGGIVADPNTQADFPQSGWLYRCRHTVWDSIDSRDMQSPEIAKDIRARRKLARGELFLVIENNLRLGTSFQIRVSGIVRVLVKLP